jgi:uncharacterized protein YbjT (DUF2867 family)
MTDYSVVILGGSGQVGSAVIKALLNSSRCREVVMITRRAAASTFGDRVRPVVMDTESASFEPEVAALVQGNAARPVYGVSCVGIGSGSAKWSEQDILKLEVGVVSAFARGCKAGGVSRFGLLSAAAANPRSWIRYARHMGLKEEAVRAVGFSSLAIFRPGIIAGNSHTPGYVAALGRLLPGMGGTMEQEDLGKAFVRELERGDNAGTTILHRGDMR